MLFHELDQWAYDIEQQYKDNIALTPRQRRQYLTICSIRDRLYENHLERIRKKNQYTDGVRHCPSPKWCKERFSPSKLIVSAR